MSTCATVPRLTGTLRAYAGVGDSSVLNLSSSELYEELKQKRKARANRKQFSWEDLKRLIDRHCPSKDKAKVVSLLRQLETSTKALIGIDVPEEELQSATANVFDLLKGTTEIGGSEIRRLKELFGPFPATSANDCCSLVQQILSIVPHDITEDIHLSPKVAPNGFNFNIDISVDLPGTPSLDDEEHIEQNGGVENLDNFIHKFREKLNTDCSAQQGKKESGYNVKNYYESNNRRDGFVGSDVEEFGPDWLYNQCSSYSSSSSGHGSLMNIIQLVLDKLMSPRNNDELQDELFDLLGYEAFELIQVLLQNRLKVTQLCRGFGVCPDKRAREKERGRPVLGPSVTIQSEQEKQLIKQIRKDEKKMAKLGKINNSSWSSSEAALVEASKSSLFGLRGQDSANRISYPYVFDSMAMSQQAVAHVAGAKILLPPNVERENNRRYEEVFIPPTSAKPPSDTDDLFSITNLDEVGKLAFKGIKKLNRIQSVVFEAAYHSNENLLVCAPTGAGKTNIALLTIVQEIKKNMVAGVVKKDQFKVVYVAPMKALAAEMTANFGKRLEPLGIIVRELTGDMQLTKAEILKTQMLVTTPEKWDVVTRKSTGDVALAQLVKLLIIDEVHLLHDDRGSVIESLVARTIRQVESSQSMIRIIGLSATLPNYLDVARFLNVNPYKGLFFFDGRFRPVPLGQSFIGVKATNFGQQIRDTDEVCYDKVLENVKQGHQVMVFVHARNATVRTALLLREFANNKGDIAQFQVEHTADFGHMEKQVGKSRNKQLRELFPDGFGIHHAGMLRQDRTLMESLFSKGFIKVLVCTATLAWGVNLPAHAVIIKGTEIYDAKKGAFVDLGILDVMQIFGRAGRPQYDTDGLGYIITKHDKLTHYLSLLTRQTPIESQFVTSLTDNLNAEVSLGTVSNIEEAVKWLSYTYLYVRMRINPLAYGITFMDKEDDPLLEKHRKDLICAAGRSLDKAKMIRFDERTGYMFPTDLGRIASNFYIKFETIEVINEKFKPFLRDPLLLEMISLAHEFQQLKVRDDEVPELEKHLYDCQIDDVKGGVTNEHGKVNILLQTYVSRGNVESFSLVSDMSYVAQNAARIIRALFEIALKYGWPVMAGRLLSLSKTVDKRLWEDEHPLRQFDGLNFETLRKLEAKKLTIERLRDMEPNEIGYMIHHVKMGDKVKAIVNQFPMLTLACNIQPITRTVLRVTLHIVPEFVWNDKVHGSVAESWWIWVEDPDNNHIYHSEHFILLKKQVKAKEPQSLIFTIPIFEPLPSQYIVHAISDRWIGAETMCAISFKHLILPERHPPHTELLDLQPLPVTALKNPGMEALYKFSHFNPVQTQIFHTLYYTDTNVLLGAPTGSGKTVAAELGIFKAFRDYPHSKVVYIAPLKALVRERMEDWKIRIERNLKRKVIELTGDVTPDMRAIAEADLIVTTPEKWDGVSRSWQTRNYVKAVSLLVIDEIHLLGDERGPVLEVIVSRTNFISAHTSNPVRVIGLSTALANARDLADWLGIEEAGLFNFRPSVRPVPLEVHIDGYPGKHYCPRMATMNKPCFKAIRTHSPEKPVLIFVSSRRQTRLTAIDLISFLAADDNPKQWMHMAEEKMDNVINNLVTDQNLKLTLSFGIGLHHAGLVEKDRKIVEELFVNQKIQVLIATATLAWGVNFPAHLVIVKGTEFFDGKTRRYVDFPITDVLQMMGRAGRPQFDDNGVAVILVQDIKKHFYKKFLYEPFPVESSLLQVLSDHLNAEIVAGTITSKQDAMDYITWTYFFRRLLMNPTYYDLDDTSHDSVNELLSKLVQQALFNLENSMCAEVAEDNRSLQPTVLGRISSYYYLSHYTMRLFRNRLSSISTLEELLTILTDVKEYDELPVRHNEDQLNGALAATLPLKVDQYSYDSPHVKAHLLLQAHFSRVPLPIADYQTDTKSVLDQAIRILQAMIDVAADEGWLATSLRVMHLVQMVTQGRWHHDCPLLCLPNVDHDLLYLFNDKGRPRAPIIDSIPELLFATANNSSLLHEMLGKVLSGSDINAIEKVLRHLPQYNVELGVFGVWANQRDGEKHRKSVDTESRGVAHQIWTEVHADQEYALQIDLTKINWSNAKRIDNKAYAPLFPKTKTEGWWFVLGETDTGELVALKRVGNLRKQQRISMAFYTPEKVGKRIFTLFMMSDSYIGLDQQFDIHLDVIPINLELQNSTDILE